MLQQDEPDDYVVATGQTHHGARVRRGGVRRGRPRRLAEVRRSRIRGSSVPPRSTCSSVTPPRPETSSAGRPRSTSGASCTRMLAHDLALETRKAERARPSGVRAAQGSSGRSWNASTSDSSSGAAPRSQQREQQHPQREHRHRRTGDEARLDAEQQVVAGRSHGDERDDADEPPDRHACVAVQGDDRLRGRDRHHVERARRGEHREVAAPQVVVGPEEDADDEADRSGTHRSPPRRRARRRR